MRRLLFCFLFFSSNYISSQVVIEGKLVDVENIPIFAANVFLKSNSLIGTATTIDGFFSLKIDTLYTNDTLQISSLGYQTVFYPVNKFREGLITLVLKADQKLLNQIVVRERAPISEQFSVIEIKKLDIYFNPVANGDALKAITSLPSSTNTDESANPSLRGSSGDANGVVLNEVLIHRPVRNSQINGIGNFSLFNTEIIRNQYVYASNPPLVYGNITAGLIEIQTLRKLTNNTLQFSAALANVGFFAARKIKNENSFIQLYGNAGFSNFFLKMNAHSFENLKGFGNYDAGLNFHYAFNPNWSVNLYSYGINENYKTNMYLFTYQGVSQAINKRNFNILNVRYAKNKFSLSLNSGTNHSKSTYNYGNIRTDNVIHQYQLSINGKYAFTNNMDMQSGIAASTNKYQYIDSMPIYFYALAPFSPNYLLDTILTKHTLEAYWFGKYKISSKFLISAGIRKNIPIDRKDDFISFQSGVRYNLNSYHSLLLSGGKYHRYSVPDFFKKSVDLLYSYQLALDYSFEKNDLLFKMACFLKKEKGEFNEVRSMNTFYTKGIEFAFEQLVGSHFKVALANTFLDRMMVIGSMKFPADNAVPFNFKSTLSYNNPKLFTTSLTFFIRNGTLYTPIAEGIFNNQVGFYEPVFDDKINSKRLNNYCNASFNISKYSRFKNFTLIPFLSLNNILNFKNESNAVYAKDYSSSSFEYFQLRTLYLGIVLQIN